MLSLGHKISFAFLPFLIDSVTLAFLPCLHVCFCVFSFFFPCELPPPNRLAAHLSKFPPPPPFPAYLRFASAFPSICYPPCCCPTTSRTPPLPSMGQDANSVADSRKSQSPSPSAPQHRRGYQACDPCRKRKVKCDLGSMRSATPPPSPRHIRSATAD